jgi:hypothetical protein
MLSNSLAFPKAVDPRWELHTETFNHSYGQVRSDLWKSNRKSSGEESQRFKIGGYHERLSQSRCQATWSRGGESPEQYILAQTRKIKRVKLRESAKMGFPGSLSCILATHIHDRLE